MVHWSYLDLEYLLSEFEGMEDLLLQVKESFWQKFQEQQRDLFCHLRAENFLALSKSAHLIRGGLLNIGLKEAAEAIRLIEEKANGEQMISPSEIETFLQLVESSYTQLDDFIRQRNRCA